MKLVITWVSIGVLLGVGTAYADSFTCKNNGGDALKVVVRASNTATRAASVLIISDPEEDRGHRTIAAVSKEEDVLEGNLKDCGFDASEADEQGMIKWGPNQRWLGHRISEITRVRFTVPNFQYNVVNRSGTTWNGNLIVTYGGHRHPLSLTCVYRKKGGN